MSHRAGGGADSSSSSASPDGEEAKESQDNSISAEFPSSPVVNNVPPPFAKTYDEIDICPCCDKRVTDMGILCENCYTWFHQPCSNVGDVEFKQLASSREAWYCNLCQQNNKCCPTISQTISDLRNDSHSAAASVNTDNSGQTYKFVTKFVARRIVFYLRDHVSQIWNCL